LWKGHEPERRYDRFMKLNFTGLWGWSGKVARGPFVLWAVLLFAFKYNIDRLFLKLVFGRDWSLFSYVEKPIPWLGLPPMERPGEYAMLLGLALPFLWLGIALCIKRLRSASLPLWLAVLFVVPVVKWILFLALTLVPERGTSDEGAERQCHGLGPWFPKSAFGSATLAVALSTLLALGATALGTLALQEYGWGLFVGVPFCLGFFAALIHGARYRRTLSESMLVATLSVAVAGAALVIVAIEGLVCILMAAPLALALAAVGALAGHVVQSSRRRELPPQVYCVPLLAIPFMLWTEHWSPQTPPLREVTTAVEINASPQMVWQQVVSFSELPPPKEMLFRLGIAYPIRAEIQGQGPGAVRNCVFSTGPFVEPIEIWDEPRLLRFSVTKNPEPMQEWTPYRDLHPAHLNGFLVSRHGQFLLRSLPGGRTRLEGTTWYCHSMWPTSYWQLWSDQIIHVIHRRVLTHVRQLAEEKTP